ncbi:hypothetical protein PMAYCL1PPCAC_33517 [Pristionchus mayeri]|uniref:Uncharacterized protein n=1 Tax=Pristionchus mayeri TaxID=1317129 RepID=A0AAN5DIY6_9BILA|nr:hypothetical protein PMAYCL1PPCAC_00289 [Pristionchus mayeri]GMR63322.1 hypothetical protein PMAYCL1PPCAC_33517 [Pristionchus mayeri]
MAAASGRAQFRELPCRCDGWQRHKVDTNEDTSQIFMSVITHLCSVIGVRKVGIAEKNGEKEHIVVSIDDHAEESEEDQGQGEDDQSQNKWQCVIS